MESPISYAREFGQLIKLAIPLALAQLAQNSLSFVDTVMVGRLNEDALAGIGIGAATFFFVGMFVGGILYAVAPMVSHCVGSQKEEEISRVVRQGFWLAILAFVPTLVFFWNAEPVLRLLGQKDNVIQWSTGYLKAVSFGMLPYLLMVATRGYLEGISRGLPIFWICIAGVLMNVFLNDALMFGRYGLPRLELVGTGIATSIVYLIMFLLAVVYVVKRSSHPVFADLKDFHWPTFKELLRVGLPIGMTIGFESSMFTLTAFAMGIIDATQLAAHQVAIRAASFSFMLPLGVALATSVRVGNWAGSGKMVDAKRAGQVGMATAVLSMLGGLVLFGFFPRTILGLFVDLADPKYEAVVRHGVTFLQIAALFQLVDGLQVSASQSLRGLKKTREAMVITLIAYWVAGVPCCLLLAFPLGFEGAGLWYGMTIGLALAALMLTWRFHIETGRLQDTATENQT